MNATVVWFRQDLRLQDNPAVHAAVGRGGAIVPVFILDPEGEGRWRWGGASRWWLHHSLAALETALRARGSRLRQFAAEGLDGHDERRDARRTGEISWTPPAMNSIRPGWLGRM